MTDVRRRWTLLLATMVGWSCGDDEGGRAGATIAAGLSSIGEATDATYGDSSGADGGDGDAGLLLDAGTPGGPPGVGCDPDSTAMGSDVEFSYIWIANSPEGTVSKIDTRNRLEVARYYTGPSQGLDDPSRTSVNLHGDVAVANRRGGIAKFAAELERCEDRNDNGAIETSSGPGDVLPWELEECRVWYHEITVDPGVPQFGTVNPQGPRPTAWDIGENLNPCADDHRVWVGWYSAAAQTVHLLRLEGSTGAVLDTVDEVGWPSQYLPTYGPYGGAIAPDNALWLLGLGGPIARVDPITLDVERWDVPSGTMPYGIAMDADGHPWMAGLHGNVLHFDPAAGTFDVVEATAAGLRGLQVDRDGIAWVAHGVPGGSLGCGLVKVDVASRTLLDAAIPLPGCKEPVGVSVDVDGFVWLPDKGANGAYKVDPVSHGTQFVDGLVAPYTYSDMTGAGLALVALPPQG